MQKRRCKNKDAQHMHRRCKAEQRTKSLLYIFFAWCTCIFDASTKMHVQPLHLVSFASSLPSAQCTVHRRCKGAKVQRGTHNKGALRKGRSHWCALHLVSYGQRCIRRKGRSHWCTVGAKKLMELMEM